MRDDECDRHTRGKVDGQKARAVPQTAALMIVAKEFFSALNRIEQAQICREGPVQGEETWTDFEPLQGALWNHFRRHNQIQEQQSWYKLYQNWTCLNLI